jgi:uncharacterized membrane protein YphA (DoxX/SURF4 family)
MDNNMRAIGFSHIALVFAMLGLGALGMAYGDFALQWQAVPQWLPWRQGFACISSIVLLASVIGTLFQRLAMSCALALVAYLLIFWLLPHAIALAPALTSVAAWLGFCESLAVLCGAWILWISLKHQSAASSGKLPDEDRTLRVVRILFGFSCVIFGISHFVYADFTASMIPAWIPQRLPLAYLTGAGHVAAGLGILCSFLPRLAATLEAAMMSMFVLLLHIPSVVSTPPPEWAPTARIQWTALCWALALAASAGLVAYSLRGRAWGLERKTLSR